MDIGTALAYFLYSKTITSFNALDRAFTELNEAIDVEKYGAENTIRGLLGQEEPYLFETVLVSRGNQPLFTLGRLLTKSRKGWEKKSDASSYGTLRVQAFQPLHRKHTLTSSSRSGPPFKAFARL